MPVVGLDSRGGSKETRELFLWCSSNLTSLRGPPASLKFPESSFVSLLCPGFLVIRKNLGGMKLLCLAEPDVS